MEIGLVALEPSGTHLTEGNTGTVVGVDIRRNLEDKTGKLRFFGLYVAFLCLRRTGRGGYLHETVQEFLHTEVVQGRTEEYGSDLGISVGLDIELRIDTIDQLQILAQFGSILLPYPLVEFVAVDIHLHLIRHTLFVGGEEVEFLFVDVVHALELGTLVDGPT